MENPFLHGNKSPNILPTSSVWLLEAAHRRCACTMSPLFSVQLRCTSFQLPFQSLWWPVPSVTIQKTVDSISASCFVPGFHAGVWFPAYAQKAVVLDKCFQQQSAVLRSFVCVCVDCCLCCLFYFPGMFCCIVNISHIFSVYVFNNLICKSSWKSFLQVELVRCNRGSVAVWDSIQWDNTKFRQLYFRIQQTIIVQRSPASLCYRFFVCA